MNNTELVNMLIDIGNEFFMRASGAKFSEGIPNDKCKDYADMIDRMADEISNYNNEHEKIKSEALERRNKEKDKWIAQHDIADTY